MTPSKRKPAKATKPASKKGATATLANPFQSKGSMKMNPIKGKTRCE